MWSWRGRELANPVVILRRLIALPLIHLSRVLLSASVFIGWGWGAAVSEWRKTA
jgi:hypothetical protein